MSARRWAAGLAIVAALVGTAAIVATSPDDEELTAPFLIEGGIGDTVTGRHLAAVVESVGLTEYLDVRYREAGDTSTDGVWVVVETVLTTQLAPLSLNQAQLWIGDVHYRVSDILPSPSAVDLSYGPDIPQHGALVFEIPRAALDDPGASRASIALLHTIDARLDSVPVVVVDLTGLDVTARERIDAPTVVEQ